MILYEMLEGRIPFSKIVAFSAAQSAAQGKTHQFREGVVPELRELIEQCWAADANQRPSFLEIIKSLWLRSLTKKHCSRTKPILSVAISHSLVAIGSSLLVALVAIGRRPALHWWLLASFGKYLR